MTDEKAWQWLINGLNGVVRMLVDHGAQAGEKMTRGQQLSIEGDVKKLKALLDQQAVTDAGRENAGPG